MTRPFFDKWAGGVGSVCADRCAEFGDPVCWEIDPTCGPCADCLRAAGFEQPDRIDPNAVVEKLL